MAVLGLAYYLGMIPWQLPFAWRSGDPRVRFGRVLYCASGIVFVVYLVYAEVIQIGNICLWCTSVHVVTFLMFALLIYDATSWGLNSTAAPARR